MRRWIFLFILVTPKLFGQCPTIDLTVPSTSCISEPIKIINSTTGATSYEWDFCPGDLLEDITAESAGTLSGISSVRDITAVNIAGEGIYAFVVAENAKLLRIEFGLTVDTNYTTTDLGNLGGLLSVARGVSYVNEGGNHKLLIGNSNGTVVLVDFGTDLTSNPSSSTVSGLSGLSGLRGLKLYTEGNNYLAYAIGTGASFSEIELIDFGNALSNTPSQSTLSLTGVTGLTDFSLIRDCDQWYGLTAGFSSNEIYKVMLGSDPRTVDSQQTLTGITVPLGVELKWELGNWHGFVSSDAGNFYRIDFGADFTATGSEVFNDLTNFNLLATNVGFDIIKVNGRQYGLATNFSTSAFNLLNFGETCNATPSLSTASEPQISYSQSGTESIELIAYDAGGSSRRSIESISISTDSAPSITFTTSNECVTQSNTFTPVDGGGLTYAWDFDNNGSTDSTTPSPLHTLGSIGDHDVKLTVDDGTCTNIVVNTISIFPVPPTPSFTSPGLPHCTNAELSFANTSIESNHVGATITYDWDFQEGTNNNKDATFTFATSGTKDIELTMSIPGCTSPMASDQLTLIDGPTVAFSNSNYCFGETIQFTNETTGLNIAGYVWDFDDGSGTSTDVNPQHLYVSTGTYNVNLTASNASGCQTSFVREIIVTNELIDFSASNLIENLPTQFTSQDQTLPGDAITSWNWDFDGLGTSTSENPIFVFPSAGTFSVNLDITTQEGCSSSVVKNIEITEAICPTNDLTIPASACLNENINLISNSVNFSSYEWDFCPGDLLED
ncbi:MAG: PKD domain-containing protein, partial [Reichenbachiella sp.]|uniref:PKD domain-containing protein n=2 Tax=Reichenbachiella sp. TaxID=2184521 RepID=UPI003299BFF6